MTAQARTRHIGLTQWATRRTLPRAPNAWVLLLALPIALPVLVVLGALTEPTGEVWRHLSQTLLADYIAHSLWLLVGVAGGVLLLGLPTAWLTARHVFPGQRFFSWALLLPMAMPAYILAYTYTGLLDFAGPVQSTLRELTGWKYGDYAFPDVRSLGGAILMLSLVLYPYVYLLARAAFAEQSASHDEIARLAGLNARQRFLRVGLPMARPAIVAGLMLALMETLADYGTVQYFGVPVFTTGIFRTWFGLGDLTAAAQLSGLLTLFVLALLLIERRSRRHARYHHGAPAQAQAPTRLRGPHAALATTVCLLPLLLGFLLPTLQLAYWAADSLPVLMSSDFLKLAANTFFVAGAAAGVILLLALLIAFLRRLDPRPANLLITDLAQLGYAVPGTVIAVGVLIPLGFIDNRIDAFLHAQFGVSSGLLLSGTLVALIFAYAVRFLSLSLSSVEAGLSRVRPSMLDAARALGQRPGPAFLRVHLPIIRGSLLTAALLTFVEVLKELPATLILRPFNFNTLAVRAYEMANDERLADAALPALTIVLIALLPVILLSRAIGRPRH